MVCDENAILIWFTSSSGFVTVRWHARPWFFTAGTCSYFFRARSLQSYHREVIRAYLSVSLASAWLVTGKQPRERDRTGDFLNPNYSYAWRFLFVPVRPRSRSELNPCGHSMIPSDLDRSGSSVRFTCNSRDHSVISRDLGLGLRGSLVALQLPWIVDRPIPRIERITWEILRVPNGLRPNPE